MRWFGWGRKARKQTEADAAPRKKQRTALVGGRRYLADAFYVLPKDEGEINRLDFQHYMLRFTLRSNYLAPIGAPTSVLDVGCGTGRWPVELAREFPQANVIGLDLEELGSTGTGGLALPANYSFIIGNVLEGLPFPDANFDFVHQRLLMGAIPGPRWPGAVAELVRVTRPGGWVELVEAAPASGGGPALATLNSWMEAGTMRRGIDVYICNELPRLADTAGLTDIGVRQFNLPMGRQHGHLGQMAETQYISLFEGLKGMILSMGIVDEGTFNQTLATAREEMSLMPCVSPYTVTFGRRPGL